MGWINTVDKSLINTDSLKEIKLYEITNAIEKIEIVEIVGIYFDGEEIILGYADGPDGAEDLIGSMLSKQFYRFSRTFMDICEENCPTIKTMDDKRNQESGEDMSKYHDTFQKYWDESHKEMLRIRKSCSREEIEIDCYL